MATIEPIHAANSSDDATSRDELAGGIPMRSRVWLDAWRRHLQHASTGTRTNRYETWDIQAVDDAGHRIGHLPLASLWPNSTIDWQLAGAAVACGDYVGFRCRHDATVRAADAIAHQLLPGSKPTWRRLRFEGVVLGDEPTRELLKALANRGAIIRVRSGIHVWFKPVTNDWQSFLASNQKNVRATLRRRWKAFENNPALEIRYRTASTCISEKLPEFIDLHQRRWNADGLPGSFATAAMRQFIGDVVDHFGQRGQVRLGTLEENGTMIAGELQFVGADRRWYIYSTAVDPQRWELTPGSILSAATLREACQHGCVGVDYMRGDEEYKRRIHAVPIPMLEIDIFAPTRLGRLAAIHDSLRMKARRAWRRSRGYPAVKEWTVETMDQPHRDHQPRFPRESPPQL